MSASVSHKYRSSSSSDGGPVCSGTALSYSLLASAVLAMGLCLSVCHKPEFY